MPFLEAVRQLGTEVGYENALYVHTTLIPVMGSVGEQKTKPTQHSVKELMGIGIRPDIIVGRSKEPMSDDIRRKISMFCGVPVEAVISSPDARSIYEVPIILEKQGIADYIIKRMNLTPYTQKRDMKEWESFLKKVLEPSEEVTIALVGKYTKLADSYLSHIEAFAHAGAEADTKVPIMNIKTAGGGLKVCPEALPDDRKLDLVIVEHIGRLRFWCNVVALARGKVLKQKNIIHKRIDCAEVICPSEEQCVLDGEMLTFQTLKMAVYPRQIKMRV